MSPRHASTLTHAAVSEAVSVRRDAPAVRYTWRLVEEHTATMPVWMSMEKAPVARAIAPAVRLSYLAVTAVLPTVAPGRSVAKEAGVVNRRDTSAIRSMGSQGKAPDGATEALTTASRQKATSRCIDVDVSDVSPTGYTLSERERNGSIGR